MKVCLLNLTPINNSTGGSEKVFFSMIQAFIEKGLEVVALTADASPGKPFWAIPKECTYINVLRPQNLVPLEWKIGKFLREINGLFHYKKQNRKKQRAKVNLRLKRKFVEKALPLDADVYLSFQPEGTQIFTDILGGRAPIITMCHGIPSDYLASEAFPLYKNAVENCAALQVLQKDYVEQARGLVKTENILYIPNFIDVPRGSKKAITTGDKKRIVNLARLSNEKRQLLSVQSFALLAHKYPDWHLDFWGNETSNGHYTKKVKELIHELRLEERVDLCGVTSDVPEVLSHADIFLFPSEREGFSLALGEAMINRLDRKSVV